jgi:putative DNA primase/helicase
VASRVRAENGISDTAKLLDALELFLRRFVVLDEAQATAATLWTPHTWTIEAARATPYLFVTSAEPECGKTRLLEVLHELAREPLSTMNISDAALFRAIDQRKPTLFLDEVDAAFNPKARERGTKDELRSLLNAGYRRGQFVYRMGGGNHTTLERFEVFGAKALAGLGSLPLTLQSRCIRLELTRRRADEPVEDFYPSWRRPMSCGCGSTRGRSRRSRRCGPQDRRASRGSATA